MTMLEKFAVELPTATVEDRSGEIGQRLLRLLSLQAERHLRWIEGECTQTGLADGEIAAPSGEGQRRPLHNLYILATSAAVFAVLARFGRPGQTMGGASPEKLAQLCAAAVRASVATHPLSGSSRARPEWWDKWFTLRMDYIFGLGAWLMWDQLDRDTQMLVARILEHDSDLYNNDAPPHLLYDDTQAESNAWTASGLALAYCMLKRHPRRRTWGQKAKEFMISAYATERDVASDRVVDGRPLKEWLDGPNAFADYTVENHGFIHPIYIAAVSEMVRTAVFYRFAGEAVPEAATFNADHVLDVLMLLNLPDGNHFYVQGTDYCPRRLDSFLQTCNVIPLRPDPFREACFRRVLGSMEKMARERPDMWMSGNILFPFDFGSSWGLIENYLMRRVFGSPAEALPADRIEPRLAGVHVNRPGKFAIHRTARTLSSFSWHAIDRSAQVMGFTIPLDKDVLCCAHPSDSYIGRVVEAEPAAATLLRVRSHDVQAREDGFGVTVELERCGGKVRQQCAFVSLPDGRSVYLELRTAVQAASIASADSGGVYIYDDLRWPFQKRARVWAAAEGVLTPESGQVHAGAWVNVDDRLGYVAVGADGFTLAKSTELYHTWRLGFRSSAGTGEPRTFAPDERISAFALVSCPNWEKSQTAELAADMAGAGWEADDGRVLALVVKPYLVYANFATEGLASLTGKAPLQVEPQAAGWAVLG